MLQKFVALLRNALPEDILLEEICRYIPEKIDKQNHNKIIEVALEKCVRVNWEAYLENNKDVKELGFNPIKHFVYYGIYEGRKLYSCPRSRIGAILSDSPLITVVVASYNNDLYLNRCIDSLLNQTLTDIEIIIVDDASTDKSNSIIQNYVLRYNNIRAIIKNNNKGTLDTRKRGVMAAKGKYLMFIDSDDYYSRDACEIAYNTIIKGYDIVKFGVNIIDINKTDKNILQHLVKRLNNFDHKIYRRSEISNAIFIQKEIDWMLWTKIFPRELCVNAYNDIRDVYLLGGEDVLALSSITKSAKSMFCIANKLYNWNYGSGVSTTKDKSLNIKNIMITAKAANEICSFAKDHFCNINNSEIYKLYCHDAINKILKFVEDIEIENNFKSLLNIFGVDCFLDVLINNFSKEPNLIITKYKHHGYIYHGEINNIGIIYNEYDSNNFSELNILVNVLNELDYKVCILTEGKAIPEIDRLNNTRIINIPGIARNNNEIKQNLIALEHTIKINQLNAIIFLNINKNHSIWQILLLNLLNIPVILVSYNNLDIAIRNIKKNKLYLSLLSCIDLVISHMDDELIFYRYNLINACMLDFPINRYPLLQQNTSTKKIAIIINDSDTDNTISEYILLLYEIIKIDNQIVSFLIVEMSDTTKINTINSLINEYNLNKNIIICDNSILKSVILNECSIFISSTKSEYNYLNIIKALPFRIVCIVLDTVTDDEDKLSKVIRLNYAEINTNAKYIINLLKNINLINRLCESSQNYISVTDYEGYRNQVGYLLKTFSFCSPAFYYPEFKLKELIKLIEKYINR